MFFAYFEQQYFNTYVFCKDFFLTLYGLSFMPSIVSFSKQLLTFMKPNTLFFFFFAFMDSAFGILFRKSLPNTRSPRFSPMLSSRNFTVLYFTVLYFTFRPILHFNFCERCKICA